jgi:hypothetical protein
MVENVKPVEMRLMALGAALVNARIEIDGEEAAHIIADAMDYIDDMHKRLAKCVEPKERKGKK